MDRIAIIGDSNSTSYLENDDYLTPMNNLFSYHLAQNGFEVIPMAFVSNNTRKIIDRSHFFLKNANAKYFVLQIGWIDSSPIQYPGWLSFLINLHIKGTKKILQNIVTNNKNYYKKNYKPIIPIKQFQANLSKIINRIRNYNSNCEILFLTIPYSPDKIIDSYRQKYNLIINEIARKSNCYVIDTYEFTKNEKMLNKVGHFSAAAHKEISLLIKKCLDEI